MSPQNSLPGIPLIESPFFERFFHPGAHPPELIEIAKLLRQNGFATLRFPDPEFEERAEKIKQDLRHVERRLQDGWKTQADVKALAVNETILKLLSTLYGRKAIPFQTLNFPVGTQQHFHSDAVHFSSIPERFMCGVWIALEDIHADAGPLEYFPGTHRWPIYTYEHIGGNYEPGQRASQDLFHQAWRELLEVSGITRETFLAKKGDALIWCANLLHGGAPQLDPARSRWSQVTHYYFEDCAYYTPMLSEPFRGTITFREIEDIATGKLVPNMSNGAVISRDFIHNARSGHHRLNGPSTRQAVRQIVKATKKRLGWG
jgi:hypothetical protein